MCCSRGLRWPTTPATHCASSRSLRQRWKARGTCRGGSALKLRAGLLAGATRDDEPGLPGGYFTETTLVLRSAVAFIEAGKPARSAVMFGDVLANAGLSRRDTGFFSARRAAALALSGEPDEAATVGLQSV